MKRFTLLKSLLLTTVLAVGSVSSFGQNWELTTIDDLSTTDVFLIVDIASGQAMANDGGTTAAPKTIAVTLNEEKNKISGSIADNLKWTISGTTDNYTFYPNGATDTWLYCTATNNGVRVGTNTDKTFSYGNYNGSVYKLKHNKTNRYVGVYNSQDWRCYTSATTTNITNTDIQFFKYTVPTSENQVATPTFAPAAGEYWESVDVTLACETEGATIRYTTDGNEPTETSAEYTAAIPLTETTTIKAKAFKDGMDASYPAEATYTIKTPATAELPYTEDFATDLGDWYAHSVTGDQTWRQATSNGKTYATINGFSGAAKENEDWLISPKFVSATDGIDFSFASATAFTGNQLALKYSTDYKGYGDPAAATWTDITDQATWATASGTTYPQAQSGTIHIAQTTVHIAFVYTSTTAGAAAWQVTDIAASETPNTPTITATPAEVTFDETTIGASVTSTINVTGANLTDKISVTIDTDNNEFTTDVAELPAEGGTITVTYTPATPGEAIGIITLTSGTAEAGILLGGNATLAAPVAAEATEVTHNSFTANWEAVQGAEEYTLTISKTVKGMGTETAPYSIEEYIAAKPSGEVYVHGYAAGVASSGTSYSTTPNGNTNIALAVAPGAEQTFVPVELPKGTLRTNWGLQSNPSKLNAHITVKATRTLYFSNENGLKSTLSIMDYASEKTVYNGITGTSHEVTGLAAKTEYTYTVTAKAGNVVSAASNEMGVTTTADPGEGTGIAALDNGNLYVADGILHFNAADGERVEIYNSLGQAVYTGTTTEGMNHIAVEAGVMVVKVGNSLNKVIVK